MEVWRLLKGLLVAKIEHEQAAAHMCMAQAAQCDAAVAKTGTELLALKAQAAASIWGMGTESRDLARSIVENTRRQMFPQGAASKPEEPKNNVAPIKPQVPA